MPNPRVRQIAVVRIDPFKKTVAPLLLKGRRDVTPDIRRVLRARDISSTQIMEVHGMPLIAIGGTNLDYEVPGWRLRGMTDTAGISMLCGRNDESGILAPSPVNAAWVREQIIWVEGESGEALESRAAEIVPLLNPEIRGALIWTSEVAGKWWLSADSRDAVGTALITLGLATVASGGQQLTALGVVVRRTIANEE